MTKRLLLKNRFLTLEVRYLAEISESNYFARLRTSVKIHLLNTVLNKIGTYITISNRQFSKCILPEVRRRAKLLLSLISAK